MHRREEPRRPETKRGSRKPDRTRALDLHSPLRLDDLVH